MCEATVVTASSPGENPEVTVWLCVMALPGALGLAQPRLPGSQLSDSLRRAKGSPDPDTGATGVRQGDFKNLSPQSRKLEDLSLFQS